MKSAAGGKEAICGGVEGTTGETELRLTGCLLSTGDGGGATAAATGLAFLATCLTNGWMSCAVFGAILCIIYKGRMLQAEYRTRTQ